MQIYPFGLRRGDSYRWRFLLWNDPQKTEPFDLTGITAAAEIRQVTGGSPVTILLCTIAANAIDVTLNAAACRGLPATGAWDLQLTNTAGGVQTIIGGPVTVEGDITASTAAA